MEKAKILLVEDEDDIRNLIKIQLELHGHFVTAITDGNEAIESIQSQSYDLFVLDRMLPGISGLEICKFIRNYRQTKNHPILFVTALTRSHNIVEGLDAGADDYITKPFDMEVLLARVKSLLRRYKTMQEDQETTVVNFGKIKMDMDQCMVWIDDVEIHLTVSEYKLLTLLVQNSRKVLSRTELVKNIQGESIHVTERTIDTHISGLRKKLGIASNMIETIRGIGYRVNDSI